MQAKPLTSGEVARLAVTERAYFQIDNSNKLRFTAFKQKFIVPVSKKCPQNLRAKLH